ncbi:hypothetical protein IRT45_28540 [Nocardia sp. BSTN01]|uniref:hypothetical protein n=1 Tax=Nocardia sp. BSTN01 TaxID=2783665 RepID=UPI00188EA7F2|nr:hypothetical protein [Nocardia sp. BSTN01]MBF5001090.1 hypothetical protein [Nocardia sp. BSTN01]
MYGYLWLDVAVERVGECDRRIRSLAAPEDYDLGMVFHERRCGRAALDALTAEVRRAECRNVAVPSVEHPTAPAALEEAVEARLRCSAGAEVLLAAAAARGDEDGRIGDRA